MQVQLAEQSERIKALKAAQARLQQQVDELVTFRERAETLQYECIALVSTGKDASHGLQVRVTNSFVTHLRLSTGKDASHGLQVCAKSPGSLVKRALDLKRALNLS